MKTELKPRRKTPQGVFSDFSLQDGDRITFLGKGEIEISRGDCVLCRARSDWEPDPKPLTKRGDPNQAKPAESADSKTRTDIPEGARWITVNPSGVEGEGHPVLIMPHEDGSATVIGGAGGKLNMLKLRGIKSPEEWRERAKKRKEAKKQKESELSEEDKAEKEKARSQLKELVRTEKHDNALSTLNVLEEHGIDHGLSDEHKRALQSAPDPGSDPEAIAQWKEHSKAALQRIKEIQDSYEHKLVTDHDARSAALVDGDPALDNRVTQNMPHVAATDQGNELAQLVQAGDQWVAVGPNGSETFDSWEDAAIAHVKNVQQAEQEQGLANTQPDQFYSPADWVKDADSEPFNPVAAMAIARLAAERREVDKAERLGRKEIDSSKVGADGITLKVKEITDEEVINKLGDRAKTLEDAFVNDSFLKLVDEVGEDAKRLQRHAKVGGYAKLAEIASDVLKQNPLSRAVVDAVGHNEAAKILAHQMRESLSPQDYNAVVAAQAAYHARTSSIIAKSVAEKVKPLSDRLRGLHEQILMLENFADGDLTPEQQIQMDTLTYDADVLVKEVQQTLGTTLGQLQASAAMTAALEGKANTLEFVGDRAKSLLEKMPQLYAEGVTPETSLFESFGLDADDYDLFDTPDGDGIRIKESGFNKLAQGYNPEDTEAYERAIAIKRGDFDEPDFVPAGFSHYASASFSDVETEASKFDTHFEVLNKLATLEGGSQGSLFGPPPDTEEISDQDIEEGLRSYIGARTANGEDPLRVMQDVRSPEFYLQQGLDPNGQSALRVQNVASEMVKALSGGDRISDANIRKAFQALGDAEAAKQRRARQTDDLQALHSQEIDKEVGTEALHRTLAAMPMGRVAFKDWSDLSAKERSYLRQYAITEVMGWELKEPPTKSAESAGSEPQEVMYDLFGNEVKASEITAQQRGDDAPELSQWQEFSKLMGGDQKAYAAVRDHLKGKVMHRFANAYGAISGEPPMIGGEPIAHVDKLLLAKLPEEKRSEMLRFMRERDASDRAKVRSRSGGKFAAEIDEDWLAKYEELKGDNRQISLLASSTGESEPAIDRHRTTLGTKAESQLHDLAGAVTKNFEQINDPVKIIPNVNWGAGTPHVTKQRVLKMLETQKRTGLHAGAGSGKTATMMGCFTHLHNQGKTKKALICVPSSIVGQFVGECATFLEPGKYNYTANLGWDREQRLKAYSDPDTHIHVTTRESFTNDMLHLVEKHQGVDPETYRGLPGEQQKQLIFDACKAEGIDTESLMLCLDEAQDATARGSLDPSKRSLVFTHMSSHSGYYLESTADPIKNDMTEMYHFLNRMAPDKFNDMGKFMAEYGANTDASRRSLQRAIAPYSYAFSTKPTDDLGRTLRMNEHQPKVKVSDYIAEGRQRVLDDVQVLSKWRSQHQQKLKEMHGSDYQPTTEDFNEAWNDPDVRAAVDRLGSEDTWHSLDDDGKSGAIGGQVMALGGLKRTALNKLYHLTDFENNPKAQWTVDYAIHQFKDKGDAGVIFSASSKGGQMLVDQLKAKGLRVGFIHGGLNAQQKDAERVGFQPGPGQEAKYDVLVCTDAAQTGVTLTRGKYMVQYDIPTTEKSYSQRSARIHRLSQDRDTTIVTPMLDTPEERIAWARMERKGKIANPLKSKAEMLDESGLAAEISKYRQGAIAS